MQRLLAIALLTWKAAFRFRLFWVLAGLLTVSVVGLPLLLKDDGTARGFTQILLTYTLSVITALLGFSTLWLACGTLARDIEECQVQIVAVKPVARWQIWLGKWLGILMLNAALLTVAGASVYGLLQWRAQRLAPEQRQILRQEIFVARASLKAPMPDLEPIIEQAFQERLAKNPVPPAEHEELRQHIREYVRGQFQIVPANYSRRWTVDLGLRRHRLRGQPLYLRVKFFTAEASPTATYLGLWQVGVPEKTPVWREAKSQAADTFHEFAIPPDLFDENGTLTIDFINRNETALLFPLEEGLEVLYREGGFGLNFVRGLGIIFCWLALLAALGLAAASLLSFPVAAFFSVSLLLVTLSSGTLSNVVAEGTVMGLSHEGGPPPFRVVDAVMLPVFRAILGVVNLVQGFSPIDSLSTGRSITWGQLARAFGQIVLLLGGVVGAAGIAIFTRRELATAQGNN